MTNREEIIRQARGTKIDFIGIGVPRAGTTHLMQCLGEHPQICISSPKETNFFNQYSGYAYGHYFKDCQRGSLRGEFTPLYYLDPEIGKVIHELFPEIKLIVCLRDPVERLISHYNYDKNRFGFKKTFNEVINDPSSKYLDEGFYYKHLNEFLEPFGKEVKIFFIVQEEMKKSPEKIFANLFSFLGVDSNFNPPSIRTEINTTSGSSYILPTLNSKAKGLKKKLQNNFFGRSFIKTMKMIRLHYLLRFILSANSRGIGAKSESVSQSDKDYLKKIYSEDSRNLGTVYNLSVPWL